MDTETLIVGGGLSGLALARLLQKAGKAAILTEARDRFGGRIKGATINGAGFDLGPAWYWPGQPRMSQLVADFRLRRFDQYAQGDLLYEDAGQVQRGRGFSSMEGSWRVAGGFAQLIEAMASALHPQSCRLSHDAIALDRLDGGVRATFANGATISANRVVLALPPRVAAKMRFTPELPAPTTESLEKVPTWMAGQAKALAIYDTPFWREAGLSGDAMSKQGPMVELHDASPNVGGPYALFGFIGLPPQNRGNVDQLKHLISAQLIRLFGSVAQSPKSLIIQDWAMEVHTATAADRVPLYAHPNYGLPPYAQSIWDGRIIASGTETARQFGGYLEGALEAAEDAFHLITDQSHAA